MKRLHYLLRFILSFFFLFFYEQQLLADAYAATDLRMSKSVNVSSIETNQNYTYTLTVTNVHASARARGVTIRDTLPSGVTLVSSTSPSGWSCSGSSDITCSTTNDLNAGDSATVTLTVKSSTTGTKNNSATASSPSPEVPGNEADNTDSATIDIFATQNADMQITKSADNTVYTDDTITYTLRVKNNGPDYAKSVSVTDNLPATLTNIHASGSGWSCTSGSNVTCNYSSTLFPPNATKYISITAKAPHTPQDVSNTANVSTTSTDSNSANNQDTKVVTVDQAPLELYIGLYDSADPVNSGDTYDYIVNLENASASVDATDIKVVTRLNTNVKDGYTGYTGVGWSCDPRSGQYVTCYYSPTLPAGTYLPELLYLHVTAPATQGTYYSESKVYDHGTHYDTSGQNTKIINTSLPADVRVVKTATKSTVHYGDTFYYYIKVKNLDYHNYAQNVSISDTIPAHFTFKRFSYISSGTSCSHTGNTVTCSIPSLKYRVQKTIKIKVKATGIVGGPYTNTAFIGSDNDNNSANNQSSVDVTIDKKNINGKARAQKWSNKNLIPVGDQFYFKIYMKNRYSETIENVVFTDTLPNGIILDHITPRNSSLTCSDNRPTVPTTITCTIPSLAKYKYTFAKIYVSVPTIAPDASKIFTNKVTVTSHTNTTYSNSSDTDQVEIYDPNLPGNIKVSKTASSTTLYTDDTFDYTLTLRNMSASYIKDVTLVDTYPSEIEILSVDEGEFNSCTTNPTTRKITCHESLLNPSKSQNVIVHARAKDPGVNIRNVVDITAAQDNDSSDNEAEAFITIIDSSLETDLGVRFKNSSVTIDTDTDFYYTVEARNHGSVDANQVEVNTTLPDDFSVAWNDRTSNGIASDLIYVSNETPSWSCTIHASKIISCTKAILAASSSSDIKLKVHTPNQSGWIYTDATISSLNLDLTPSNNQATQKNLISEAQADVPKLCYEEPPTYVGCTNNAGLGCKQTINIKNIDTHTLYDVKVFIDSTGYGLNYISECGTNGVHAGCSTGNDVYFLNGNFNQAIQFNSPYSYSSGAINSVYTINNTNTSIYDGNNLYARYYDGNNHYGALNPCPLPEPDPGDEPNYNSCGIFPDVLNEGLLNTFAFPTILETNSYNDIVTSDLGGADLTSYLYKNIEVNTDATFAPAKTYNNTSRKLMLINHLNVTADNVTLTFNAGNYYINEFSITGNNVSINVNGKVRFFVGGTAKHNFNVSNSGFNMNSGGTPSDLYLFSTGEINFVSGASSAYNINAYLYSTKTMTLDYNANSNHFTGAFSTENTLNTVADSSVFTYVDTTLEAEGYGECPRSNYGDRNFVLVNPKITRNLLGDVRTVGNTVTCISDDNTINGSCRSDANTLLNENSYVLYTNIEKDEGRNTISVNGTSENVFNSSGALIDINVGASYTLQVEWAGLYWQGSIHNWNASHASGNENWLNTTDLTGQTIDLSDASQYGQNRVALHTPSMADGEYKEVTTSGDYFYDYYNIYETDYSGNPENGGVYSIYTDVTDIIKAEPDPNGEYRIANLQTMKGKEKNLGNFGGWSLVVIYSVIDDPDQKFKNISVYSGYKIISSNHSAATSVAVSGFRTPSTTPIDSTLSIFAGEGEDENDGDYGHLTTQIGTNNLDTAHSNNLFRGIISGDTASSRTPAYPNTNGIDIQNFDVGGYMSTEESSATIELGTDLDTFFPSMITFATELHKPNICYDYAIKQNGHFLPVDLPSSGIPDLNQTVLTGTSNPLEFNIYFKNREGDIEATKLSLHTNFYHTPDDYMHYYKGAHATNDGSVWKSDVNSSYYRPYPDSTSVVSIIDEATTKGVRIGIGNNPTTSLNGGSLGLQESQYVRFSTYTDKSTLNMKLKLYLDMVLKFNDGLEINLNDYALGSQIKHCQDANPPYNPLWGQFTVIDHELNNNVNDPANIYYNLRTQVSERPYKVDLVSLKESETHADVTQRNHWEILEGNTTVHVELADLSEFSDINASCGDTFNTIPQTQEFVTFGQGSGEWKKALSITSSAYARKNVTYRVWFLEDNNGSLIQHNCGNPASSGTCYRSVYATTFHANGDTFCQTGCASSDLSCYECLRGKYGKALCSRDNFSIRPEAFDIEGLKDMSSTGNFFSPLTPYTLVPDSNKTHHIAARYPYRLDINATGYCYKAGVNTKGVPGYNNEFSKNQNLSSFTWFEFPLNSVTCNDENDQNISLAFNNTPFSTSKTKQGVSNIGKYTIALRDTTWTNVDKDSNATHHNNPATRNFFLGATGNKQNDCKLNKIYVPRVNFPYDANTPTNERYFVGCDFSSQYEKLSDTVPSCNPTAPYGVLAHAFNDYNVTAHPHHISLALHSTTDVKEINTTSNISSSFIYTNSMINNINNLNMSIYLDTTLSAVARDDSVLSNFTENCYAQGLDMNFSSVIWHYGGEQNLTYFVETSDANFSASANDIDIPKSSTLTSSNLMSQIYISEKAFRDDMNGTADVKVHLNLERNINEAKNPFRVHFNTLNLGCTRDYTNAFDNPSDIKLEDCNYTIDGNTKAQNKDYSLKDRNITFIFGRAHAPRYRVDVPRSAAVADANISIFYEAYCDVRGGCTLLDDVVSPNKKRSPNSVNWYLNEAHNKSVTSDGQDGNTSLITQFRGDKVHLANTGFIQTNLPGLTKARLIYDDAQRGYPYRATMKIDTNAWLNYNKFDNNVSTANRFEIEFRQKGLRSGDGQDMNTNGAVNSNRRIMW